MAHKKQHRGPIPPGNKPQAGPEKTALNDQATAKKKRGAPLTDQDAKRRLGDFEGAGEHAFQQPGGKNDANH